MKSCIFRNRHNLIFWLIAAPANNKCSLMECENKHMPWAKINSVYSTIDSNNCFTCENPRTIIHNVLLFLLLSILLQPSYALNIQGFLLYYLNVDIYFNFKTCQLYFYKEAYGSKSPLFKKQSSRIIYNFHLLEQFCFCVLQFKGIPSSALREICILKELKHKNIVR